MKIYLAARYSRHVEMHACRVALTDRGHEVTSRWINGNHQIDDGRTIDAKMHERIRFANEDIDDLLASDCVISFTEAPWSNHSRGGRHVEFGLARAWNKRLIVIGYRENVFHWLPEVEFFECWDDALATLGGTL